MSNHRKSFRRKIFRTRKRSDSHKKKSEEQTEGFEIQPDYQQERYGPWFSSFDEVPAQACRRLDTRQRRLNCELLRAIDEGTVQRVAR